VQRSLSMSVVQPILLKLERKMRDEGRLCRARQQGILGTYGLVGTCEGINFHILGGSGCAEHGNKLFRAEIGGLAFHAGLVM
jgi:hypothetical protein